MNADPRHRILSVLAGVKVPMASAILTVTDPMAFTVTDYRSSEALDRLGEPPPTAADHCPPYRRHRSVEMASVRDVRMAVTRERLGTYPPRRVCELRRNPQQPAPSSGSAF